MKIFTVTGGRTGTAWLAKFLYLNLGKPSFHEQLGVDSYFSHTPNTAILRWFNTHGYTEQVKDFWSNKFKEIDQNGNWFESSHLLSKAGLIEYLVDAGLTDETYVIVLKRSILPQCLSYILREDFVSRYGIIQYANIWQFYLDNSYSKNILSYPAVKAAVKTDDLAYPIWYALEMDIREHFYQLKYGNKIKFIEVCLENVSTMDGASELLSDLGLKKTPIMPGRENANEIIDPQRKRLAEIHLRNSLGVLTYESEEIAREALRQGHTFWD